MTNTNYNLSVTGEQGATSASMSSQDPRDLMRLLQLCGQDATGKTFNLNVSSSESGETQHGSLSNSNNLNVSSHDANDIARILQLCGLQSQVGVCPHCNQSPCVCDQVCPHCNQSPCACGHTDSPEGMVSVMPHDIGMSQLQEQQAEYDYGHRDSQDEQTHFDMDDYVWKGRADFPERVTNARFGSNAMANELKEHIHKRLQDAYAAYVAEGESSDASSNREGRLSPLTANQRQEFDKDPAEGEPDTTGEDSPMTRIVRQHIPR
jgi:hypothetical protein